MTRLQTTQRTRLIVLGAALVVAVPAFAQIQPVAVTGYDVAETPASGFGCWSHVYTGTITDTGRIVGGSVCTSALVNYSGGGGTLTDGEISTSTSNTQLFTTRTATDGQPIRPVITLHLARRTSIAKIAVFEGNIEWNGIPGALSGATVEIAGVAVRVAVTPVGTQDALLDLTDTPLAGVVSDTIVLRDFTAALSGQPFDQFSITEITVEPSESVTPVAIDVVPANTTNRIVIAPGVRVRVAVLSSASFDAAAAVDRATLTFGHTGDEHSLAFCEPNPIDVNRDRRRDVVCFFATDAAGFHLGETLAVLKGRTTGGTSIMGQAQVKPIVDR